MSDSDASEEAPDWPVTARGGRVRNGTVSPLHIGPVMAPIFGLWHGTPSPVAAARLPDGPPLAAADVAPAEDTAYPAEWCVICPPFRHEYVVSHLALRLLAEGLSRDGLPALRFDYLGTGDAAGETEDTTLELWIQSAGLAADEVRRRTQGSTVSLIGVRIGATVALQTALERRDVRSLVLWDPVLDGDAYLSGLRARQEDWARMYAVTHWRGPPGGEDHFLGYPMSPALRESLEAVRPEGLRRAPARRVLIVASRPDSGVELVKSLEELGVAVELLMIPEADVWNQSVDIVVSTVPTGVLRDMRSWLARASHDRASEDTASLESPSSEPGVVGLQRAGSARWRPSVELDQPVERAVIFGEPGRLVGVLTQPPADHFSSEPDGSDAAHSSATSVPASNRSSTDSPAVILLNAGLIHRAGPQRLWVRAARRLALGGRSVLRFDYSGVGDSPPRQDHVPFHESRILETRAAMDFLTEETGHERFVLMGLCTGADYGFGTAMEDSRVVGLVLLDGYPFRTAGWYLRYYGRRMLSPRSWWRLLSGRYSFAGELIRRVKPARGPRMGEELARQIPTRSEMAKDLRALVSRGVHLHFVYTGGLPAWYNYEGQFEAAFGRFGDRVKVTYLGEADHVFTPPVCQQQLLDRLARWLGERFEVIEAAPAASPEGV